VPGWDLRVLDETGNERQPGEIGALVVRLPMPPGCAPTLWNADARFRDAYLSEFPGYYATADAGYIDEDGYLFVMARTDDIINVAGHRLSTGAMEEVLAEHPDVAEVAVVGLPDDKWGEIVACFVRLEPGCALDMGRLTARVCGRSGAAGHVVGRVHHDGVETAGRAPGRRSRATCRPSAAGSALTCRA